MSMPDILKKLHEKRSAANTAASLTEAKGGTKGGTKPAPSKPQGKGGTKPPAKPAPKGGKTATPAVKPPAKKPANENVQEGKNHPADKIIETLKGAFNGDKKLVAKACSVSDLFCRGKLSEAEIRSYLSRRLKEAKSSYTVDQVFEVLSSTAQAIKSQPKSRLAEVRKKIADLQTEEKALAEAEGDDEDEEEMDENADEGESTQTEETSTEETPVTEGDDEDDDTDEDDAE